MASPEPTPRQPWWRRVFGLRSERAATKFLERLGYRILATNYRCTQGEMDIIALDGQCLVFVEVRSTATDDVRRPALSVDEVKQERLTRIAVHYLQEQRLLNSAARFDVLAVSWKEGQKEPVIQHYPNAFEAVGKYQMFQ